MHLHSFHQIYAASRSHDYVLLISDIVEMYTSFISIPTIDAEMPWNIRSHTGNSCPLRHSLDLEENKKHNAI